MPHCARCLIEYVEGMTECEDCGAVLLPGPAPEDEPRRELPGLKGAKLVRVRVFSGPTALLDADMARNILEAQGIPGLVPGETSVELLPVLDVPLLVREEDLAEATQVLREYLDSSNAAPPE